jgi:hypothetical protein
MKRVLLLVFALALSATMLLAQNQAASTPSKTAPQKQGGRCPEMTATTADLDQLEKTLASGSESNDPAKMKAALEQAQTQLADARHHMSMCPMMNGGKMRHAGMKGMSRMQCKGNMKNMSSMKGMDDMKGMDMSGTQGMSSQGSDDKK